MKQTFLTLFLTSFVFASCGEIKLIDAITSDTSLSQDDYFLEQLYSEITTMAGQFECDDASEWRYTAIGAKACGGPTGYVAYSSKINEDLFLEKVEFYTSQQAYYNSKWSIISDCSIPEEPSGVVCNDGKPEFSY